MNIAISATAPLGKPRWGAARAEAPACSLTQTPPTHGSQPGAVSMVDLSKQKAGDKS